MPTRDQVESILRQVADPELGVNIVDLGLVYEIRVKEGRIEVEMTLTTPACPLSAALRARVEEALRAHFPGHEVEVGLVWEPHWTPERMSEDARRQLGAP